MSSNRLQILKNYLAALRYRRFATRDQLERWQNVRVERHLARLLPKSPFLQERFEGIGTQNWRELPPITKVEMMANFDRLNTVGIQRGQAMEIALKAEETRDFSPMVGNITVGLSSGTSGARGLFLASPEERATWAGTILARALPRSLLHAQRIALFLRANSNLYATVGSRRIQFEFFDLLKPLSEQVEQLNRYQPTTLVGPASLLRLLAEEGGLTIEPEKVIAAAEVLEPQDAELISARFGSQTHQIYQATEGFLGASRSDGRVVLNEDQLVIEKDWLDREAGVFVPIVTDFLRTTQPIIRYRLDDVLVQHKDPGVYTVLDRIEGRCDDLLRFGERVCFPDFVRNGILRASAEVKDYRVVQRADESLEVGLLGPQSCEQPVLEALTQLVRQFGIENPQIRLVPYQVADPTEGRKLRRITRDA